MAKNPASGAIVSRWAVIFQNKGVVWKQHWVGLDNWFIFGNKSAYIRIAYNFGEKLIENQGNCKADKYPKLDDACLQLEGVYK